MTFYFKFTGILVLLVLLATGLVHGQTPSTLFKTAIVLKGTIVTPNSIIQNGFIVIENDKISGIYHSMSEKQMPPNAIYTDTKGIIFPGLIDLHNHVSFNVFPIWRPGRRKFPNRYEWRFKNLQHQKLVMTPFDNMLEDGFYCKMNAHGELRALTGGTTSIFTSKDCINRHIRNLGDPAQVDFIEMDYIIDIQNHKPGPNQGPSVDDILAESKTKLEAGTLDVFLIHLAEGKANDSTTKQEFTVLQDKGLLTDKTIIIHGISFGETEFQFMKASGASLVWSPRSNIELYGQTMDVITAKNAGLKIALAPDWAITGSKNMLEELQYASAWNKNHLDGVLSDKDLVEMVTSIPASMIGLENKLGSIIPGAWADLLIVSGDPSNPYGALVKAGTENVMLVIVNGVAVYGQRLLMEKFYSNTMLDEVLSTRPVMVMKKPFLYGSDKSYSEVANLLRLKMAEEKTSLAPLFERKVQFPLRKRGVHVTGKELDIENKN